MQEFGYFFILKVWNDILPNFQRISQVLHSEQVNLKTYADLYSSLDHRLGISLDSYGRHMKDKSQL